VSDLAIRVENLSKAYRIGLKEQRHETLAGAIGSFVRSPLDNYRNLRKLSLFKDLKVEDGGSKIEDGSRQRESGNGNAASGNQNGNGGAPADVIWALKDVSFEVKHGEVLGIIGRNGAGKSTLLKLLSRIMEPTSGRAEIYGRVGSLLEVGTGFHPDLTGRENVYLNGTILGMRKSEVDRKFDEIVAFSEVEKFIDTPVKRYSSGMRVRLAFAVAAYLEPEILVIDEVLAVGDAAFQKKCLGKMQDVAGQGRTVLFVSHNMSAVLDLCTKGIVLSNGTLVHAGSARSSLEKYMDFASSESQVAEPSSSCLTDMCINQEREPRIQSGSPFEVTVRVAKQCPMASWIFLIMEDSGGRQVFHKRISWSDIGLSHSRVPFLLKVGIPGLWLNAGIYTMYVKILEAGLRSGAERIESERLLVEVHGEFDNSGKSFLNPEVVWATA
jgi:lipopolysaccharide transport system ATP-binding protein